MIRLANKNDIPNLQSIYSIARELMKKTGNPDQWKDNFPPLPLLFEDIEKNQLYVIEENSQILGAFAFIIGPDATYQYIENGSWLSENEYGTIHRVASNGKAKGCFKQIIQFCESKISHLRIDTHMDNKIMQHLILKNGFSQRGIIYVRDNSPRLAYEKL